MQELHTRLSDRQSLEFQRRFNILLLIITVAMCCIVIRLVYLQLVKGEVFLNKSENNSIRLRKIRPARGLIFDVNHEVMVENEPAFDLFFAPNRPKDVVPVMGRLKELYAGRAMTFSVDLTQAAKARPFAPIRLVRNASREQVAIVETNIIDLPGVSVEVTPIRHYHDGEMISHVVGYTGEITEKELENGKGSDYGAGDVVGKYGIEKYLDIYLRGKNGAEQVEVNVQGKKVKVLGRKEPEPGYNVVLTLDTFLQRTAWEAMKGKVGAVVVMDTRNGAILTLVSTPSFDPNIFNGGISFAKWENFSTDKTHPMENRALAGQYPPGSTYKLVVAAAGLQEGLITPEKTTLCNGAYELGNHVYRCWQKKGHGVVNLHRAIVESCDVYFYNLGKMLGVDTIARYSRQFGFGKPTGVDLPREKRGLIPTRDWKVKRFGEPWQAGETISVAIGQGFNLVTPLQLVNAYAALANGGTLFRPHIIKRIETSNGQVLIEFVPQIINRLPLSGGNLSLLNYGLWGAVNESGGTGYVLRRRDEDFCGKTGTAQVVGLPENEKQRRAKRLAYEFRDHALFVCFGPYKKSEIAVAVIAENAGHGGTAAAPVARKIVDAYFSRKTKKAGGKESRQ